MPLPPIKKKRGLLKALLSEFLDSSSSEDDADVQELLKYHYNYRNPTKICSTPDENVRSRKQVTFSILPHLTTNNFQIHFRIKPKTFDFILGEIGTTLKDLREGRPPLDARKQLMVALGILGSTKSYRWVSDRFEVHKSSALRSLRRVVDALCGIASRFIKWPCEEEALRQMGLFDSMCGFPGVIGVLGATHVYIAKPIESPNDYMNRLGTYSIQIQAVCDAEGKFIHCFAGTPGSVSDQRVFLLSDLSEIITESKKFPDDSHLVADAGYEISNRVMVPFTSEQLTTLEVNFNTKLLLTRQQISLSFGQLRRRFKRFSKVLDMNRVDLIPDHLLACCVIHNICIQLQDELDDHVDVLIHPNDNDNVYECTQSNDSGVAKRDMISHAMYI